MIKENTKQGKAVVTFTPMQKTKTYFWTAEMILFQKKVPNEKN